MTAEKITTRPVPYEDAGDQLYLQFEVATGDGAVVPFYYAASLHLVRDGVRVEINAGDAEDIALSLLVAAGVENLAELQEDLDMRRREAASERATG